MKVAVFCIEACVARLMRGIPWYECMTIPDILRQHISKWRVWVRVHGHGGVTGSCTQHAKGGTPFIHNRNKHPVMIRRESPSISSKKPTNLTRTRFNPLSASAQTLPSWPPSPSSRPGIHGWRTLEAGQTRMRRVVRRPPTYVRRGSIVAQASPD